MIKYSFWILAFLIFMVGCKKEETTVDINPFEIDKFHEFPRETLFSDEFLDNRNNWNLEITEPADTTEIGIHAIARIENGVLDVAARGMGSSGRAEVIVPGLNSNEISHLGIEIVMKKPPRIVDMYNGTWMNLQIGDLTLFHYSDFLAGFDYSGPMTCNILYVKNEKYPRVNFILDSTASVNMASRDDIWGKFQVDDINLGSTNQVSLKFNAISGWDGIASNSALWEVDYIELYQIKRFKLN